MGKSQIDPFATSNSSGASSGSDVSDGKSCSSGEDEPRSTRRGPWGRGGSGGMHPMMLAMMMGGGPPEGHGRGYCHGHGHGPPPFVARSMTPDGECPRKHGDKQRRCHSAPGRQAEGGPCGPCGPAHGHFGPPGDGPGMGRKFMFSNPEFWQKMHQYGPHAAGKFSKMEEKKDGKKCGGRKCAGKSEEKWQRFMKHMFDEMSIHNVNEAAKDKKKVPFGDAAYDQDEMTSRRHPWMFQGIPWGRPGMFRGGRGFRHGRPWAGPENFGDMHMHGDGEMGHGHPGMMHGGPRMWMFRQMMNPSSSEEENTGSDGKEGTNRCQIREKRQKFRRAVQEMGVQPWMFKALAQEIYGKKADAKDAAVSEDEDGKKGRKNEKREKYLQTLREIGAHPWMFTVLANQRARAAAKASDSEGETPLKGATAAEGSPDRRSMRNRRKMFRQMAKQMGCMSDSDGEALTDRDQGRSKEDKEKRKAERQKRREMMREMGWMPWMMMGRGHHNHHHRHHHHSQERYADFLSDAEKSGDEQDVAKCHEKREKMGKEIREKRQKFREVVQEMGVRPWMFRSLTQEIYGKKSDTAASEEEDGKKGTKNEKREKYLQTLREIGAHPWMFRVLVNQRAHAAESEGESSPEGAAAAEGSPDRRSMRHRRKMFRQMAKQMGWMSDSDGEALTDGEEKTEDQKKAEKERRKAERQKMREMMRGMGWMPWMTMGRGHHHHHHHSPGRHVDFLSDAEKSGDEQEVTKRENVCENRQKFREVVQEMGVRPWMFKTLAQEIYGKKSDAKDAVTSEGEDEKKGRKNEKREKYLQTLREIGAHPWMFRVLANQRARAAAKASDSEGESSPEGAAAAEGSPDRRSMRHRRKMAKQMGWMSDSDGEALIDGEEKTEEEKKAEKERRKAERQKMREMMREMGWMPWMMGRAHNYHHHSPHGGAPHMMGWRHDHPGHVTDEEDH